MKFLMKFLSLILVIGLVSCAEELDFNQAEDLEASPTIAVSLINFELDQTEIFDEIDLEGIDITSPEQELDLPDLSSSIIQEDLDRIVFEFEWSSDFEGTFTVNLSLMDDADNVTYTFDPIEITATDEGFDSVPVDIVMDGDGILNSTKVTGTVRYEGDLDASDSRTLTFQSAGIFYFTIE